MTDRPVPPAAAGERRSPTPAALRKRAAIHQLKKGLAEDRLVLHYQPIVDPSDGRARAVEALLRWREGQETQDLTPLVTAAERSPVIFKLENWTLSQSLRAAGEWRRKGLAELRLHVNLSAREFPRADLVRRLRGRISAARLEPTSVGLEITETSSIHDFSAVADEMRALEGIGIELWLDDFGTGHSSLEWLSHLPCHGLKIPGTFVDRLLTERRCRTIVARVIELAHDLGLKVVGEGVETADQRDFLVEKGCDLLQGFLFQESVPAGDLPAALGRTPAEVR